MLTQSRQNDVTLLTLNMFCWMKSFLIPLTVPPPFFASFIDQRVHYKSRMTKLRPYSYFLSNKKKIGQVFEVHNIQQHIEELKEIIYFENQTLNILNPI